MSLADHFCADEVASVFAYRADALAFLRTLPDNYVHAVICDPPYGLGDAKPDVVAAAITAWATGDRERVPDGRGFMGRRWDAFVPPPAVWDECLRVLKPGGHLAVFAGSRTADLMGLSIRLAGFDMRDGVSAWLYGSGFPKSHDIGKAIDKVAGATREVVGVGPDHAKRTAAAGRGGTVTREGGDAPLGQVLTAPATDAARAWSGWGTALKPAWEPVLVAQKPQATTGMLVEIGSHLDRLERECSSSAPPAAASSTPSLPASPEVRAATAPGSAATPPEDGPASRTGTGAAVGSPETTATSWSGSTAITCSSTVSSWRASWVELCSLTSTCTTSTTSETTTDLATLSSCLRSSTAESIRASLTTPAGSPSPVAAVDALFAAAVLSLRATLARSAVESATAGTQPSLPAGTGESRLSPQCEPILIARKPLAGATGGPATVAANTLAHGCGGLNVDATRVQGDDAPEGRLRHGGGSAVSGSMSGPLNPDVRPASPAGRWPTNVVLAHAPLLDPVTGEVVGDACADGCVPGCHVRQLDEQSGTLTSGTLATHHKRHTAGGNGETHGAMAGVIGRSFGDSGGASRFYPTFRYTAKAGKRERPQAWGAHPDCACEPSRPLDPETGALPPWHRRGTVCATCERPATYRGHPTVKPQGLLEWLVALLTPTAEQLGEGATGTVLDPFAGSGSLGQAARTVGVGALLVERDVHSARLIAARLGVDEPRRDPTVPRLPVRRRDPDPVALLLRTVIRTERVPALKLLARGASRHGLWTDDVRAAFTARRLEIEGIAA